MHSVVYDAQLVGASDVRDIERNYYLLNRSRLALVEYISGLEARLGIPQHQFLKFD